MTRRVIVALGFGALVLAGCSEDVDVSRDEAVEVLVLDGVDRDRAVCIVDGVDGQVAFARVTGVDPDITEDELATLATVSAGCVFDDGTDASVLDVDAPEAQLEISEGGGISADVDARIDALVTGGLDPQVADCVGSAVLASDDPAQALANPNFVTEAIRVCDR